MARYEFEEGKSSKFWEIDLDGSSFLVHYGRIGTTGQSQTKTFSTPELALKEHNKLVAECTDEEFERILAINLKSVFYGCQAALRHMIPQGSGKIVNIASGAIDTPAPTLACYGMTKAAVTMLTKTLATEVGRHGIRVNAIAPGMILTNFSRHNFVDEDGNVIPEKLEQYHKNAGRMSPLGRAGEAEDVARAFLYLVSDAAAFITGQIERPNGGVSMPW